MAEPAIIPNAAVGAAADAELEGVSLDLAQTALDLIGLVDPTPVSGGVNTIISLGRGAWFDAALNGVSMVPFVGRLAKLGRLGRAVTTLERALALAAKSERAAELFRPVFVRLDQVLQLFPDMGSAQIAKLRELVREFMQRNGAVRAVVSQLPDISRHFSFRTFTRADGYAIKEASGDLGIPGKVIQHRSPSAQRALSGGTGDDAGHLIGNRFGAPGGDENLSTQNWIQNRNGTFRDLEDQWDRQLRSGTGIRVRVQDLTRPGEDRPFMRRVEWQEIAPDGSVTDHSLDFANTQTPRSRNMRGIAPTVSPGTNAQVIPLRPRP